MEPAEEPMNPLDLEPRAPAEKKSILSRLRNKTAMYIMLGAGALATFGGGLSLKKNQDRIEADMKAKSKADSTFNSETDKKLSILDGRIDRAWNAIGNTKDSVEVVQARQAKQDSILKILMPRVPVDTAKVAVTDTAKVVTPPTAAVAAPADSSQKVKTPVAKQPVAVADSAKADSTAPSFAADFKKAVAKNDSAFAAGEETHAIFQHGVKNDKDSTVQKPFIALSRTALKAMLEKDGKLPAGFDTMSQGQIDSMMVEYVSASVKKATGKDKITLDDIDGFFDIKNADGKTNQQIASAADAAAKKKVVAQKKSNKQKIKEIAVKKPVVASDSVAVATQPKPGLTLASMSHLFANKPQVQNNMFASLKDGLLRTPQVTEQAQVPSDSITVNMGDQEVRVKPTPMTPKQLAALPAIPGEDMSKHYFNGTYSRQRDMSGFTEQEKKQVPSTVVATIPVFSSDVIHYLTSNKQGKKLLPSFYKNMHDVGHDEAGRKSIGQWLNNLKTIDQENEKYRKEGITKFYGGTKESFQKTDNLYEKYKYTPPAARP